MGNFYLLCLFVTFKANGCMGMFGEGGEGCLLNHQSQVMFKKIFFCFCLFLKWLILGTELLYDSSLVWKSERMKECNWLRWEHNSWKWNLWYLKNGLQYSFTKFCKKVYRPFLQKIIKLIFDLLGQLWPRRSKGNL